MEFRNALTEMLGIQYPIIQGAFGWPGTGTSNIAVPVSNAGGLGILTTVCYQGPDHFREDLKKALTMTTRPIAVNFTVTKRPKYPIEYHREYIRIALAENVPIVFTSGYDGSPIGRKFKAAGAIWIHKCATLKHSLSAEKKGADAIVIVGREGTGARNPDQHTTLIHITNARKLLNVPVIAAGGIADARGFLAALAMGASGVYMGTAFMATQEFKIASSYKTAITTQCITDSDYIQKIYHMQHGGLHSPASGVISSIPTVHEFIHGLIQGAQRILREFKHWGLLKGV